MSRFVVARLSEDGTCSFDILCCRYLRASAVRHAVLGERSLRFGAMLGASVT